MKLSKITSLISIYILFPLIIYSQTAMGSLKYDDFKTPQYCGSACHTDFYQQWKQAMMS